MVLDHESVLIWINIDIHLSLYIPRHESIWLIIIAVFFFVITLVALIIFIIIIFRKVFAYKTIIPVWKQLNSFKNFLLKLNDVEKKELYKVLMQQWSTNFTDINWIIYHAEKDDSLKEEVYSFLT